jgi:hypothetical protein
MLGEGRVVNLLGCPDSNGKNQTRTYLVLAAAQKLDKRDENENGSGNA